MPTSLHSQISPILLVFEQEKPKSVLDIGCGKGKYGVLIKEYIPSVKRLDALEIFEPYITNLHRSVYDHIYIDDILTADIEPYDIYLLIDVIEHMTIEEGIELLTRLPGKKIVGTPREFKEQGAECGNEYERHKCVWTEQMFAKFFPGVAVAEVGSSWLVAIPNYVEPKKEKEKEKTIHNCRSCGSEDLVNILSLGNQYLSEFSVTSQKPFQYPLTLILCKKCSLVQLRDTIPQRVLYTENYGYKSGVNNTIREDLKEIVKKAMKEVKLDEGDFVLDIGANDGTLLSNYPFEIERIGCEPIKKFALECKKKADFVIHDFFNYDSFTLGTPNDTKCKIITTISCFYDLDDPNAFIEDVKKILLPNGIFIVQQNYLGTMISQNAFDNIVHEHIEFYSLLALENLLKSHNLEVYKVEQNNINGGSFRTYIQHKGKRPIDKSVNKMRMEEQKMKLDDINTYDAFAKRVRKLVDELHTFVKDRVLEGKKIYLYGASTRGNTLLQYANLNNRLVVAAVERNPEKWGKKIASMQIPIISEEQARKDKPDFMIVLPYFFKKEFLEREKEYLKNGGHFIFPLPKLEIV